ncbi:MAG: DUF1329 domain-containing protein [Gammaproteobacteria bacterium]|nr:DUF1329 domain-containing protein [Gammaproteobacteria bacterium]
MSSMLGIAVLALCLAAGTVAAAELPEGFELNKTNLDANLDNTIDGYAIRDLMTDKLAWQIREQNLRIYLKSYQALHLDDEFLKWSKINKDKVSYDPASRTISGWEAGLPFPDLNPDDPHCGEKAAWNLFYGAPVGTDMYYPTWVYLLVDGNSGLERVQGWAFFRYFVKGRWGTEQLVLGDESIYHKTLIYAREPFDIKGLGIFTLKYDSPKLEDNWAYIRSFRRVRRLSGGAWMDPIGGTDQLNDDVEIFNAHPTWYPKYECTAKRRMLVINNSRNPRWVESETDPVKRYPTVALDEPPYWNPKNDWEPTEALVVEAQTPPEHPYSKKVMYIAPGYGRAFQAETYDRKGEFWKYINFPQTTFPPGYESAPNWAGVRKADNHYSTTSMLGHVMDFQRRHATIFVTSPSVHNRVGLTDDEVTLQQLEQAAVR